MPDELVTVAAFAEAIEAEAARGFLEENGITAFIADENASVALWPNLVEPKLQVAATDVERAKQLLAEHLSGRDLVEDETGDESEGD